MDDREPIRDTGRASSESHDLVQIVQQLAGTLGQPEGEPKPLEGGITNRNFRARFDGREYVIRVPGKDTSLLEIDRTAERTANERAAGLGVAPPVAAFLTDPACIVTEFVEGTGMEPADLREPEALSRVASALRAIHDGGDSVPISFDSFRIVETYAETATGRGAELPRAYEEAHARAREIEDALTGPEHDPVPCHNDLLAANFIAADDRLWIVDWEYAGMGDRYFDLANFSINNELGDDQQLVLLEDYLGDPPSEAQLSSLRLMFFMSDFREAMWGVVQGAVSDLDFDFDQYARKHFDRLAATGSDPRFARWLEEASGAEG